MTVDGQRTSVAATVVNLLVWASCSFMILFGGAVVAVILFGGDDPAVKSDGAGFVVAITLFWMSVGVAGLALRGRLVRRVQATAASRARRAADEAAAERARLALEKERAAECAAAAHAVDLENAARKKREAQASLVLLPKEWLSSDAWKQRALDILSEPNDNGVGCPHYVVGACLVRVRSQFDSSMGPEACSMHRAQVHDNYKSCELFQVSSW